jgi:hypothetical protein
MCLQYSLIRFTPSIVLPHPFLSIMTTGFIVLFLYMDTKYIHRHICPLHLSLMALPPRKDLSYLAVLQFFKCILMAQGWVVCLGSSDMFILCFHQTNPPISYGFSVTLRPCYSTAYSALQYISSYTAANYFI